MDGSKCQVCSVSPCTLACGCTAQVVLLCSNCIGQHTTTPGRHIVSMYQSVSVNEGNSICDICTFAQAESICNCCLAIKKFCESCRILHISKTPYESHSLLPIKALKFAKNIGDFPDLQKEMRKVSIAKQYLFANIPRIEEFKSSLSAICQKFIHEIHEFEMQTLQEIEGLRSIIEADIESLTTELDEHVFDKSYISENYLTNHVRSQPETPLETSLRIFTYEIEPQSCGGFLKKTVRIRVNPNQCINEGMGVICTLKGDRLVTYSLTDLTNRVETLPFDTGATASTAFLFLDNSRLLGVGGESSRCVFALDLHSKSLKSYPSMSSIRRFPGICAIDDILYVFGGHNGQFLATCERLQFPTNTWNTVGSMLSARCGFNPVPYRGSVMLIGGQGSNGKIEKFNIHSSAFVQINYVLQKDLFTTSLPVGNSILILNSTKKYRFVTENQIDELSNCDGDLHRWSNLTVAWADAVYYLRTQGWKGPMELYRLTAGTLDTKKIVDVSY